MKQFLILRLKGKIVCQKEREVIADIENLEHKHINLDDHTLDIIANKKSELEELRSKKIDGAMLRSRVKGEGWVDFPQFIIFQT